MSIWLDLAIHNWEYSILTKERKMFYNYNPLVVTDWVNYAVKISSWFESKDACDHFLAEWENIVVGTRIAEEKINLPKAKK